MPKRTSSKKTIDGALLVRSAGIEAECSMDGRCVCMGRLFFSERDSNCIHTIEKPATRVGGISCRSVKLSRSLCLVTIYYRRTRYDSMEDAHLTVYAASYLQ